MSSVWDPLCTLDHREALAGLLGVYGGCYTIHTCIIKSYHRMRSSPMSPPPGSLPDLPAKDIIGNHFEATLSQSHISFRFLFYFTIP